jgi:electron transport complex protein RnfE
MKFEFSEEKVESIRNEALEPEMIEPENEHTIKEKPVAEWDPFKKEKDEKAKPVKVEPAKEKIPFSAKIAIIGGGFKRILEKIKALLVRMKDSVATKRLLSGIFKENPVFVLMLGLCPALAVTASAQAAVGMGLATLAVLVCSNTLIALLGKVVGESWRFYVYIVIIVGLVTGAEWLIKSYIPYLDTALGVYLPLIAVNCLVMGRAKDYATDNKLLFSFFDGLGMGLGFTLALLIIGSIREIFGVGTWFGMQAMPNDYLPVAFFSLAPGAFFIVAFLIALRVAISNRIKKAEGNGNA